MDSFISILLVEKKSIEDFFWRYADMPKTKGSNLQASTTEDSTLYIEVHLLQLKYFKVLHQLMLY